jgi:hypothetical protein
MPAPLFEQTRYVSKNCVPVAVTIDAMENGLLLIKRGQRFGLRSILLQPVLQNANAVVVPANQRPSQYGQTGRSENVALNALVVKPHSPH